MATFDIEVVLDNLLSVGIGKATIMDRMPEATIQILLKTVRQQFLNQPMLLEINSPVTLCGDIHGQYNDLLRLFNTGGWPNQTNYMFLGDYVDRGKQNVETILLLFALRVNFYGFFDECIRKYSTVVYYMFQDVFNTMPVAGLVGDRILCMHGGLSPHLKSLDDIRNVKRPIDPSDNPRNDLVMDLLWSDPEKWLTGWQDNARGVSVVFGENEVRRACNLLDIDLVARAHQVVQDGYEFFAERQLVTIFSAPHYCGDYDNAAAIMKVDENLMCSFEVLKPTMSKSLRLG